MIGDEYVKLICRNYSLFIEVELPIDGQFVEKVEVRIEEL